jgi:hypothetical protein
MLLAPYNKSVCTWRSVRASLNTDSLCLLYGALFGMVNVLENQVCPCRLCNLLSQPLWDYRVRCTDTVPDALVLLLWSTRANVLVELLRQVQEIRPEIRCLLLGTSKSTVGHFLPI